MKTNKLLSSLLAVFVGVVLFAPSHTLAAAFGVSPPWIENENLKPGSSFVYVINLSANDLPNDMIVRPELTGDPEITKWLTIRDKDNLVITKGKDMIPMSVDVNVPKDTKVGKYQGNIKLSLASKDNNTNDIAILLGGNVTIELDVINYDVIDYQVRSITVNPITEGQTIDLKLIVNNLGNTNITSVMTNVSIIDKKTGIEVASKSADKLNVPVFPHAITNAELPVLAPDLKAGNYWLDVESFKGNTSVYKNRLSFTVEPLMIDNAVTTAVEVVPEGQLKSAAPVENRTDLKATGAKIKTSVTVRAPMTNQLIGVVIVILLVLVGIAIKVYVTLKKKRR